MEFNLCKKDDAIQHNPNVNHYGTNTEGRAVVLKPRSNMFKSRDAKLIASQILAQERTVTDIWRGIDKKSLTTQINSKVILGLQAYEDDLNIRRQRLKTLLDAEEKSFHELTRNNMQENKNYHRSYMKNEEDVVLPDKKEDEHLAKKKLELDIAKFKELRSIISMRRDTETREMQKLQMKEKKAIQNQEKDVNELWHKMMTEDVEKRNALHEMEKSERLQNELKLKDFLSSQMKVSKEQKKTEHLIEKEKEQERAIQHNQKLEEAILEEKFKINKTKLTLSEQLMKQMAEKKIIMEKNKQEEIELEKSISSLSTKEYDEDLKRKLATKKQIRQEIDLFNKHFSEVKSNIDIQTKNDEAHFENLAKKQMEDEEYHRNMFHLKRKELLQNAITGRDIQMEEKKKQSEIFKKQADEELKLRIQIEDKMTKENHLDKQKYCEAKIAYKKDLENQILSAKMAKEKEALMEQTEEDKKIQEDELLKQKCIDLMKREFKSENIHPFTEVIVKSIQPKDTWYPYLPETKYIKY